MKIMIFRKFNVLLFKLNLDLGDLSVYLFSKIKFKAVSLQEHE